MRFIEPRGDAVEVGGSDGRSPEQTCLTLLHRTTNLCHCERWLHQVATAFVSPRERKIFWFSTNPVWKLVSIERKCWHAVWVCTAQESYRHRRLKIGRVWRD